VPVSTELPDADFEFFGEGFHFKPTDEYQWEMLEFADALQNGGADGSLLSGAAAVYSLLKAAIVDDEWARFRAAAKKNHAQTERDLMPIVVRAFQHKTERPTVRPSDSSDGPPATPENSERASSLRVVKRLEEQGRPDMAVMVLMAEEARSRVSA
jgi:hypothetical protein